MTSTPRNSSPAFHPGASSSETHTCPYNDCRKSFSKKYNLKAHLRLHTGEQPFECDRPDCKKKFKWRSSLSSHTIWHSRKDNGSIPSTTPDSKSNAKQKQSPPTNSTSWRSATSDRLSKSACSPISKANKRKRPRVEPHPQQIAAPVVKTPNLSLHAISDPSYCITAPKAPPTAVPYCSDATSACTGTPMTVKKQKVLCHQQQQQQQQALNTDASMKLPSSPVTSDGDRSEQSLDAELFSVDLLPPLVGGDGEGLSLDADDVSTLLTGDGVGSLFGCASPSCGTLNSLDTRFGPLAAFDLDNLSLGTRKVEGL